MNILLSKDKGILKLHLELSVFQCPTITTRAKFQRLLGLTSFLHFIYFISTIHNNTGLSWCTFLLPYTVVLTFNFVLFENCIVWFNLKGDKIGFAVTSHTVKWAIRKKTRKIHLYYITIYFYASPAFWSSFQKLTFWSVLFTNFNNLYYIMYIEIWQPVTTQNQRSTIHSLIDVSQRALNLVIWTMLLLSRLILLQRFVREKIGYDEEDSSIVYSNVSYCVFMNSIFLWLKQISKIERNRTFLSVTPVCKLLVIDTTLCPIKLEIRKV